MVRSLVDDDPMVQKRDSLALVLGLSKARVIDIHRGAASRLYLDFLQGKLQQKWALDATDSASLKVRCLLWSQLAAKLGGAGRWRRRFRAQSCSSDARRASIHAAHAQS